MKNDKRPDMNMKRFSQKVTEQLKYYVYLYIDPRNDQPFYIGKGIGNRAFSHLKSKYDSEKNRTISDLRKLGLEPRIELLKYGLSEKEALLVEATAIDLLNVTNLTNESRGHGTRFGARASVQEVVDTLVAKEVSITDPVLLININKNFRYSISPMELYDATRSSWKLGEKRESVRYAMSVYRGIVWEGYEVTGWIPGGWTIRGDDLKGSGAKRKGRWEFVGVLAEEKIRKRYLGKSVAKYFKKGAQNPLKYVNCD